MSIENEHDDDLDEKPEAPEAPDAPEVTEKDGETTVDLDPGLSRRERRAQRPALFARVERAEQEAREARQEAALARQEAAQRRVQDSAPNQDEVANLYREQQQLAREAQQAGGSLTAEQEQVYWARYQEIEARKFQAHAKKAGYVPLADLEEKSQRSAAEMSMRLNFPDVMANPAAFRVAQSYYQIERAKNPNADGATLLPRAMDRARADFGMRRTSAPSEGERSLFTGPGKSAGGGDNPNRVVLDAATRGMADISHAHIKDPKTRYATWARQMQAQKKKTA